MLPASLATILVFVILLANTVTVHPGRVSVPPTVRPSQRRLVTAVAAAQFPARIIATSACAILLATMATVLLLPVSTVEV